MVSSSSKETNNGCFQAIYHMIQGKGLKHKVGAEITKTVKSSDSSLCRKNCVTTDNSVVRGAIGLRNSFEREQVKEEDSEWHMPLEWATEFYEAPKKV